MTLSDLLGRVEGAGVGSRELDGEIAFALGEVPPAFPICGYRQAYLWKDKAPGLNARTWTPGPYTSSIDAALALVERKLPDWGCGILSWAAGGKYPVFRMERSYPTNIEAAAEGHTRPLAILACLLRALIQLETQGTEWAPISRR